MPSPQRAYFDILGGGEYYVEPPHEPSPLFDGRRQSKNVVDARNLPEALAENARTVLGKTFNAYFGPSWDDTPDNRHTQAIDGFISRLQGYQTPSRQSLISPSKVDVPEIAFYYPPARRWSEAPDGANPFADEPE